MTAPSRRGVTPAPGQSLPAKPVHFTMQELLQERLAKQLAGCGSKRPLYAVPSSKATIDVAF